MSCDEIEAELVGYHFGTLDDDVRRRVEEHLAGSAEGGPADSPHAGCAACVRAFVEIKRAVETNEDAPSPSPAARAKLRRAVARELAPRAWWERPLAIALAASVVMLAGATMHALTTTEGAPPYELRH